MLAHFPKPVALRRFPHGSYADMDGRRSHRVKTRSAELTRHALAINDLDAAAPLAANRVEVARAARHLIFAKLLKADARVTSLSTLDCLCHLLSALEFNHFSVSGIEGIGCPIEETIQHNE